LFSLRVKTFTRLIQDYVSLSPQTMSKRSPGHTTTTTPSLPVSKKRKVDTITLKNQFIEELEQKCLDLCRTCVHRTERKEGAIVEKI